MTTETKRTFVVGGIIAAVLIAALVIGYALIRPGKESPSPNKDSSQTAEVRAEVERAYLRYWEVLADATESLDDSNLDSAMTGEALQLTRNLIQEQKAKNEPLRTQVEHNYRITIVNDANASVDDTFTDRTVRLDPQTRQPTGPPANQVIRNSYTMKKESGIWKVAAIIQYRSPSP